MFPLGHVHSRAARVFSFWIADKFILFRGKSRSSLPLVGFFTALTQTSCLFSTLAFFLFYWWAWFSERDNFKDIYAKSEHPVWPVVWPNGIASFRFGSNTVNIHWIIIFYDFFHLWNILNWLFYLFLSNIDLIFVVYFTCMKNRFLKNSWCFNRLGVLYIFFINLRLYFLMNYYKLILFFITCTGTRINLCWEKTHIICGFKESFSNKIVWFNIKCPHLLLEICLLWFKKSWSHMYCWVNPK